MASKEVSKKCRLQANPCLSVADLAKVFENWLSIKLSKDLFDLLSPPDGKPFTWKTSPNHAWLFKVAPLFVLLVKAVPNTVMTSKKLIMVLEHLSKNKKVINTSKMQDQTFFDWCDQCIRILFANFREVKKSPSTNSRIQKRCSQDEWCAIVTVIDGIVLGDDDVKPENVKHVTLSPPKTWNSWMSTLQDAKETAGGVVEAAVVQASITNECISNPQDEANLIQHDVSIFKSILSQSSVSIQESKSDVLSSPVKKCVEPIFGGPCRMMENTPEMSPSSSEAFSPTEKRQIDALLKSKPAPKGTKHKSPASAKTKQKLNTTKKAHTPPQKTKASDTHAEANNKKLKHRATSSAYHKAYKDAIKTSSKEEAKQLARIAYQKASAAFDKLD